MQRGERDYAHRIADAVSSQDSLFEVPALSVPAILRRLGWNRVGLVKMDVEGHEKRLFEQSCEWLDQVDALCLEYHHHRAAEELSRVADRFGFAVRPLRGNLWLLTRGDRAA
jgi:hypothetical protein